MALNPVPVGDAIASLIQSSAPAAGTAITTDQLKTMWEGIMTLIYNDLKANAAIIPGTLSNPAGQPVATTGTATAQTGETTAPEPIIGIGRVT
jgi:hypothetical protein